MRAFELLHKIFKESSPKLHAKRIAALMCAARSLLTGKRLTLTGLGRSMNGKCTPKNAIRKVDRLLGNEKLHKERACYYRALANTLLSGVKQPLISIDWTGTPRFKFYCIRASVNVKGRSFVLFEEVHPRKYEKNTRINNLFLDKLKDILPEDTAPIIITDAGFRSPWFKKVVSLKWEFLGRVRNNNRYFDPSSKFSQLTYDLYKIATNKAVYIGNVLYTLREKLPAHMYLYKGKIKGRKNLNQSGQVSKRATSKHGAKSHRDPLLLLTSLGPERFTPKQIVNFYCKRMEIEEEFRDLKSHRFGFGLRYSRTKSIERLHVLLLIAAIASIVCWLIALTLQRRKEHYQYQANTIRNKTVLSVQFLACEAFKRLGAKLKITMEEVGLSLDEMKMLCEVGPIL